MTFFRYGLSSACDPFESHPLPEDIDEDAIEDEDDPNIFKPRGSRHFVRFDCQCNEFCRGVLSARLQSWLSTRHRLHGFMIFVGDPWVRFIRADRCGAVYSERFNFRQNSRDLLDFYWRYTKLSTEAIGLDPTVRPATKLEARLARSLLPQLKTLRPEDIVEPIVVITVPDEKTKEKREVISCRPLGQETPIVGQGTRAWPVFDMELRRVVFFKETWRSSEDGYVKECSTLYALNKAGVRNVPKLIAGGDVDIDVLITSSQQYFRAKWNVSGRVSSRARVLNRMVVDFVGKPLECFSSTKQFLGAVYDAFIAHYDAYIKCGIMHCDISLSNILTDANGHGYLNDWDMAKSAFSRSNKYHLGTWEFMSAKLLQEPKKVNDINDDIESFVYVVTYTALRYTKHNRLEALPKLLHTIFESRETFDGADFGGDGKVAMVELLRGWEVSDNKPLQKWLENAISAAVEWTLHDPIALDDISNSRRRSSTRIRDKDKPKPRLTDHEYLLALFEEALSEEKNGSAWPADDDHAYDYLSIPSVLVGHGHEQPAKVELNGIVSTQNNSMQS
ncbi:hypothetical protein CPC08DRAFT_645858 [Agrocybe pediades]|nr:hypothetical protein CPC08DRAFT_645858 [Agrocybe pediades]